jgi:hypothetical protein
MMFVSVTNTPNIIQLPVSQQAEVKVEVKAEADISNATSTEDIKRITKEYFKDTPILAEIARCESTYRQFSSAGVPLRGIVNGADVGVMQINEKYHLARSEKLGMDIDTLEGNLEYGAFLYKEQGTRPWNASKPCWGKHEVALASNI